MDRSRATWTVAGAALVAAALRLPYLWTGLSTDEGGYAYIARQWAAGARLYDTGAWIDRPQGLMLTYRALVAVDGSGTSIRALVVLIGPVMTVLVALIGWQLGGPRLAATAAVIYAVVGVAPHVEGFTLNGELLASVPATAGVAAALWSRRPGRRRAGWWLLAAGGLAGLALTMKQSGFDGLVVGLVIVLAARPAAASDRGPESAAGSAPAGRVASPLVGRRLWRARLGATGVFLGGWALPVAASAGHGAVTGWSRYSNALAGYQFSALGGSDGSLHTRWHDFARTAPTAARDIAVLAVVAIVGLVLLPRPARTPLLWWLGAAAVAINMGGSYWPHYYVQALPPLILAAGYAAVAVARRWRVVFVVAVLTPTLFWMAALVPMSSARRQQAIDYYALAVKDRAIAAAIRVDTSPDERIYVLESRADLYFLAGRPASYPYLWGKPIGKIPAAVPLLRAMLTGPDRPTVVIVATDADIVDPSGGIANALSAHYHVDRVVGGVTILRANGAETPSQLPPNTDKLPPERLRP